MAKNHSQGGFTLAELLVTITIFVIISGAIYLGYTLSQKAYRESERAAELTQNGRVILERMSREIRQAREMVIELPATSTNATSTIEFENGHDISFVHYIRYFWDDNDKTIKREVIAYYFSGEFPGTSTYVTWDATPPGGENLATTTLESPKIIGEYVADLEFWGSRIINIFITLEKGSKQIDLSTKIFSRNF